MLFGKAENRKADERVHFGAKRKLHKILVDLFYTSACQNLPECYQGYSKHSLDKLDDI